MKTIPSKITLTAGFALALAFTLSCSGEDGSDGKNGADGTSCIAQEKAGGFDILCGGTKVGEVRNGTNGTNGADGTSCTIEPKVPATAGYDVLCGGVPVGTLANGADGAPGTPGLNGANGINGAGCTIATSASNSAYLLITCGSTSSQLAKAWCGATAYDPAKQFCDSRDGRLYKFVSIGTGATAQTWMAENLKYNATGSKCGDDDNTLKDGNTAACDTYGRLYDWNAAVGVCPSGWHLPSDAEWTVLTDFVGVNSGIKLKSATGWNTGNGYMAGTNNFGFAALPGGIGGSGGSFNDVGNHGSWWSSTERDADYAYYRYMYYNDENVSRFYDNKSNSLFSVRCLQD
jgi:uncharacterized protein (TIGR02145 family)